jgi:hypothetical protein
LNNAYLAVSKDPKHIDTPGINMNSASSSDLGLFIISPSGFSSFFSSYFPFLSPSSKFSLSLGGDY